MSLINSVSKNPFSPVNKLFPQATWARIGAGVTVVALAVLAKFIYDRHISHKPVVAKPQKKTLQELGLDLIAASRSALKQSSKPFELNGAKYIAYGPAVAFEDDNLNEAQFVEILKNSSDHHVIVNLIEDGFYLTNSNIRSQLTNQINKTNLMQAQLGDKTFYHFPAWPDMGLFSEEMELALISLAREIVQQIAIGKVPFVHCMRSIQRTATFLAIVEFMRSKDQFKLKTDADLQREMENILYKIAATAPQRVPVLEQLKKLLDPIFLRKLANS